MSLINYKDIDFKKSITNNNTIIDFNGNEIQVLNYLPIHEKNDLIVITLQKSFENNIYNYSKLKMYFNLHLFYLYTNIIFNSEDKNDEEDLYDTLKRSGLLDLVIDAIPENDRFELWEDIMNVKCDMEKYHSSFAYFAADLVEDLGEKVKEGIEMIKTLNIEDTLKKIQSIKKEPEQIIAE